MNLQPDNEETLDLSSLGRTTPTEASQTFAALSPTKDATASAFPKVRFRKMTGSAADFASVVRFGGPLPHKLPPEPSRLVELRDLTVQQVLA